MPTNNNPALTDISAFIKKAVQQAQQTTAAPATDKTPSSEPTTSAEVTAPEINTSTPIPSTPFTPPNLRLSPHQLQEDGQLDLTINIQNQSSNTNISVVIDNLPAGFGLNQGVQLSNQQWLLNQSQLKGLQLLAPDNADAQFNLNIKLISRP